MPRQPSLVSPKKRTPVAKLTAPALRREVTRLRGADTLLRSHLHNRSMVLAFAEQTLKGIADMRCKFQDGTRPSDWHLGIIAIEAAEKYFAVRKDSAIPGTAAAG